MVVMSKDVKQRHWDKLLANANTVLCACGCGESLKDRDAYGRHKTFVNGHKGRMYTDPKQHKREWEKRNKDRLRPIRKLKKNIRHRTLRLKLIQDVGGNKCYDCALEYNGTNAAIFHFHHLDGSTKLGEVAHMINNRTWDVVLAEAAKCIMICANCHELRHSVPY